MTLGVRLLVFGHWADPPSLLIELGHKSPSDFSFSCSQKISTSRGGGAWGCWWSRANICLYDGTGGRVHPLHHLAFNAFISTCASSLIQLFHFQLLKGAEIGWNFRHVLSIGVGLLAVDTFDLMERCLIPLITICRPAKTLRNPAFVTTIRIILDVKNIVTLILLLRRMNFGSQGILWIGGCWGVRAVGGRI